ncbi:hypothetical protein Tsubulata_026067 [Turnera subulata]|uniref:S-adenosylmethionine-dependent methyltransferase At5g38100 n=1 Tax=Turnera subulata TaxID=218843 RepID=A0A9Q0FQS7_9ROSI|nr:hypothetical protein Tsubulata_026067 [Turnera subulata]
MPLRKLPFLAYSYTQINFSQGQREMGSKAHVSNSECCYPMSGGDGLHSYSRNSILQKKALEAVEELVNTIIQDKLEFNNLNISGISNTFHIADFGCSTGPNSFIAVQNIIKAVELKYNSLHQNDPPLEFHVFFNDHINNDFNTLFRKLPSPQEFFAAGVPGDFHGRLFPKASLHIVHSSSSVHWLSKIPDEVTNVSSPAWNKDSIYCTGFLNEVVAAYSTEFQKDMDNFLNSRAQELVVGGLMVLLIPGLPDGVHCSETHFGANYDVLRSCLVDMVKLGLINEEKVKAFNLPIYHPTTKELEVLLERNAYFSVERIESLPAYLFPSVQSNTSFMRAAMEEVINQHFGKEIVHSVFEFYAKKLSANYIDYIQKQRNVFIVLILKRST